MKRYTYLNAGLVLALLLGALLTWGLATGALAECSGNSGYMHEQRLSSGQVGEPTGSYVWEQGSPAPGSPCLNGLQNHCSVGSAACPGSPAHGACG